jgi:3-hydroxyisobutyrate dehydrogenase
MTCLPTSAEVRDVLFGEGRVAEVLQPGQIFAVMTTGDPNETREMAARLAEKGVQMIDAPVSGGPHGARQRQRYPNGAGQCGARAVSDSDQRTRC